MTTTIYVLKLEQDKYYVGKTDNINKRINAHFSGNGSYYTKKYKPIKHIRTIANVSAFQEDAITKEYMAEYGIDNVRGGSYVTIMLTEEQKQFIQKEIWMTKNVCTRCGMDTHWVRECKELVDVNGKYIDKTIGESKAEESKVEEAKAENTKCIHSLYNKIKNEFVNSDSDLRSGRFFRKFFK